MQHAESRTLSPPPRRGMIALAVKRNDRENGIFIIIEQLISVGPNWSS